MKKILASFIFLVALFIGFNSASAGIVIPERTCNAIGTGIETCPVQVAITGDTTIVPGQKLTFVVYDLENIKDNKIEFTPATNWTINGETTAQEYAISGKKVLEMQYNGTEEIKVGAASLVNGEFKLFDAKYEKIVAADPCGFKIGRVAACYYDTDNKVYYGLDGNSTTKEQWTKDCTCRQMTVNNETYYVGKDGNKIEADTLDEALTKMNKECYSCTQADKDGNYYYEGKKLTDEEFKLYCEDKCRIVTVGEEKKYFNDENKEITAEEYEKQCGCRIDEDKDGNKIYYGPDNSLITKEEYENKCTENVKTGTGNPYIFLGIGAVAAAASFVIIKRSNKFKRI